MRFTDAKVVCVTLKVYIFEFRLGKQILLAPGVISSYKTLLLNGQQVKLTTN
jgi:hypothetical protein